jgi:hypothetical protein
MVLFAMHRELTVAAVAMLLAVTGTPTTARAQRAADPEHPGNAAPPSEERQHLIEQIQKRIDEIQSQEGENSANLIEPLSALGSLHEQAGNHLLAVAATEKALDVVRFNEGLYTLEQAPLLRRLIQSAAASGSAEVAWELEQKLLILAGRHPDDLRTARILSDTADRRVDLLNRYNAGELPPEIVLGCYYEPLNRVRGAAPLHCRSGLKTDVQRGLAHEIETDYQHALEIILDNEQYGSEEIPALLMNLLRSAYADHNPDLGRRSLRYLLDYQDRNSEPWLTRIETMVQMADWELLYSHSRNSANEVLSSYEEAYGLLRDQRIPQASIDRIFSPALPVVLPAFLPNPLDSQEAENASGYIEASFEINKYGEAGRVRILDTTGTSTRADGNRLVELILRSRFRPSMTNGRFADSKPIVVRYYLNAPITP